MSSMAPLALVEFSSTSFSHPSQREDACCVDPWPIDRIGYSTWEEKKQQVVQNKNSQRGNHRPGGSWDETETKETCRKDLQQLLSKTGFFSHVVHPIRSAAIKIYPVRQSFSSPCGSGERTTSRCSECIGAQKRSIK